MNPDMLKMDEEIAFRKRKLTTVFRTFEENFEETVEFLRES